VTENAVATANDRELTLLKAIGFDRLPPEQRELALAIARRYELDPMLRHILLIDGRPYITRDGLLHVAHRSGQLDGIEVTDPVLADSFWRSTCSVYRKDMTRPFTYSGRYPEAGKNRTFGPEMAVKVAEVQALRRAFDVSAPTVEERWDVDLPAEPPAPRPTLAERAAQKAETLVLQPMDPIASAAYVNPEEIAEGARAIPRDGLSAHDLIALATKAGRKKADLATAIGCDIVQIVDRVGAMTDTERGVLADELNLDWRPA